jgi:hypothetical protein
MLSSFLCSNVVKPRRNSKYWTHERPVFEKEFKIVTDSQRFAASHTWCERPNHESLPRGLGRRFKFKKIKPCSPSPADTIRRSKKIGNAPDPKQKLKFGSVLLKAAVNKDRERVLRTGGASCRTRIVGRAARAGAVCLPPGRPRFVPFPAFCALLLSNDIPPLGSCIVLW